MGSGRSDIWRIPRSTNLDRMRADHRDFTCVGLAGLSLSPFGLLEESHFRCFAPSRGWRVSLGERQRTPWPSMLCTPSARPSRTSTTTTTLTPSLPTPTTPRRGTPAPCIAGHRQPRIRASSSSISSLYASSHLLRRYPSRPSLPSGHRPPVYLYPRRGEPTESSYRSRRIRLEHTRWPSCPPPAWSTRVHDLSRLIPYRNIPLD